MTNDSMNYPAASSGVSKTTTGKILRPKGRGIHPNGINRIQALSGDKALEADMNDGLGINVFLKRHPTLEGTDSSSLLLSIITDMPESKMINRFLIDKNDLTLLRKEIESRYEKLFSFLNKFKKDCLEKGFSEIDGKKGYWVGLKSPNIEKRHKAIQFALKWLIEGY